MLPSSNLDRMIETISCFDATLAPSVYLMGFWSRLIQVEWRTDRLLWNPCWDGVVQRAAMKTMMLRSKEVLVM
jgi:hypothetical protein